jgi:hypothetical protein
MPNAGAGRRQSEAPRWGPTGLRSWSLVQQVNGTLTPAPWRGPPLSTIGLWSNAGKASAVANRVVPALLCATAESSPRFVDKPPILQYFDARNPGERQQIICTGQGVSITVAVSEVTPDIPVMQIE